ncbi:MAG: sensor domain-containing diguanylate cyclase [Acidobacteria bacterium]|nr:MAG: sensor domain-containing diguanylate cyclase [Acidobacteriota bacterium]
MSIEIHALAPREMEAFLERRRAILAFPSEVSLADNLAEILRKANEFVPSAAGSILLDNPLEKRPEKERNRLTFVVAFGDKAEQLIGREIPADQGIAGRVYVTGEPYHAPQTEIDQYFFDGMDKLTHYQTRSLVAIPIFIEQEVCGVLELMNRRGADHYSEQDRNLLQIFAGYTAVSIQNILDGRRAHELAKRDNLTGLFNDHYLHVALTRTIETCRRDGEDLAVIFLDLDFFKRVNDTHGHLAGSQVLREVGHLLKAYVRAPGATPARYGGDEFVLVVPRYSLEDAVDLAERIRTALVDTSFCDRPGDIMPDTLSLTGITCSIGVASLHQHVDSEASLEAAKSALLRLADAAMYVAKETGRNRTAIAGTPIRRRTPTTAQRRG